MKNFIAALLLTVLSLGFYFYFANQSSPKKILLRSKNCDLMKNECVFNYQGKNLVSLTFDPNKVNNKDPFMVYSEITDSGHWLVDKMELKLQGIEMNLNFFGDLYTKNGKNFSVEAKLPFCTLKKMGWKVLLNFQAKRKNTDDTKFFYIVQEISVLN
jgi:hypothetical protein